MTYTRENPYTAKKKFHGVINNAKVNAIIINTMSGNDNCRGKVTNVKGSCDGCCDSCMKWCYARDYRYNNTIEAHADNTLYMTEDPDGFFAEAKNFILHHPKKQNVRLFASGECPTKETIPHLVDFGNFAIRIGKNPYQYTKRWEWYNEYTDRNGKPLMPILYSAPFYIENLDQLIEWKRIHNPHDYPMFIVDRHLDPNGIGSLPHCPAVDFYGRKTGIMCGLQCNRCVNGKTTVVHLH